MPSPKPRTLVEKSEGVNTHSSEKAADMNSRLPNMLTSAGSRKRKEQTVTGSPGDSSHYGSVMTVL